MGLCVCRACEQILSRGTFQIKKEEGTTRISPGLLHVSSSPALSHDSLEYAEEEASEVTGAGAPASDRILVMSTAPSQPGGKREDTRGGSGGSFGSCLRDLSVLERQLDAALETQVGVSGHLQLVPPPEIPDNEAGEGMEIVELKARLQAAENDLKCNEEIRQADELEKEMLMRERAALTAEILALRTERDALERDKASLLRKDQEGEQELQQAVEALRAGMERLKESLAREQDLTEQLAACKTQVTSCNAEMQEMKDHLAQVSASATATIVNSVTALFSKTCNQKALLLRMQAMKAWHALTQTLRSKRAAVAARALSLEPGAPEARLIFRSWHQQALTYRTTRERLQQQARQAAFARLRGGVLIWAAWSKRKRVSRRHCERLTLQVNLSVMSDSDVFLH